jgi:nucleoside-diphosphate-sugar epimerase
MESVLVTGATGFLGQHLVRQLAATGSGVQLRVLCRGSSPWDNDSSVEIFHGDVTSREDVSRAAQGVKEIYHLAGFVSRDLRKAEALYLTHVEGTRNVCEAVRQAGISRMVYVSSSGTIAVGRTPVARDERSGYTHEVVGEWPYYLSKIFSEKLTLDFFERYGLPVVVVNPSLLLGPGDERGSSTGDIELFLRGQILGMPLGGLNFVDARDAAAGLIAAMRRGRPGERYLLGGVNWTFRELIEKVAALAGVRRPHLQPSLRISLGSARLLRRLLPLFGRPFELDDVSIKMSALFWYCDSTKARIELGFRARDPMETLRETVEEVRRRIA